MLSSSAITGIVVCGRPIIIIFIVQWMRVPRAIDYIRTVAAAPQL